MRSMKPDRDIRVRKIRIPAAHGSIPALVLSPPDAPKNATGVLWLHGGGYIAGMKEMVYMSRAVDLVKRFGAVVLSPGYRLAPLFPYPAAVDDCYAALLYLKDNAAALGVRRDQLMAGGESAGGGLCAAVCIRARETGDVNVAFQMPLYPMLDDRDTETSRDNHGRVWNTRRNHLAWRLYLRGTNRAQLSPCAAPARLSDFSGLPPAYSFVGDGEPFYAETVRYFERLRDAGVPAELDVYHTDMHAFDMMRPDDPLSIAAAEAFNRRFAEAQRSFFAPQKDEISMPSFHHSEETAKMEWKYCVVGNIAKRHIDKDGIPRYGTLAYTGGTKVYLCGKCWDGNTPQISVLGLNRCGKFQLHDIPVELIENVRCKRVFKPSILRIMDNWEFANCWWHNTNADRIAAREFVRNWNSCKTPQAEDGAERQAGG